MTTYIFDLDRTLYPLDTPFFDHVVDSLEAHIAHLAGISRQQMEEDIERFREKGLDPYRHVWEMYGIATNQVDEYHHRINYSMLESCDVTRELLEQLPYKNRVIYTDSVKAHTEKVLAEINLEGIFSYIYDATFSDYRVKSSRDCFTHVLEHLGVTGEECVMIEDTHVNLKIAKNMGMRTVLLNATATAETYPYVDEVAKTLPEWLRQEVLRG